MQYKQLMTKMETIDVEGRTVRAIVSTKDLDAGNDIIMLGAFDRSLKTESIRKRIKMLWQHKMDMPIGKPTLIEVMKDGALLTETYISKIQKGEDYLTQAKEGIVDEFSIGYGETEYTYGKSGERLISDLTLYEYSPVTWGMNENTALLGIKSLADISPKFVEKVLRDVGFSSKQAKALMSGGFSCLRDVSNEGKETNMGEVKSTLYTLTNTLKKLNG